MNSFHWYLYLEFKTDVVKGDEPSEIIIELADTAGDLTSNISQMSKSAEDQIDKALNNSTSFSR